MGKLVTVAAGFSGVELPTVFSVPAGFGTAATKVLGVSGYNAGQTATLTDAEYSALPTSITRALNASPTTVPDPFRPATDPGAVATLSNQAATGALVLSPGFNDLKLTGNVTTTLTGFSPGNYSVVRVKMTQDATGSRTFAFPSGVKWPAGSAPTPTATASKTDLFEFYSVDGGTTVFARTVSQNS